MSPAKSPLGAKSTPAAAAPKAASATAEAPATKATDPEPADTLAAEAAGPPGPGEAAEPGEAAQPGEAAEPAPLNRAERRAQSRGKKPSVPTAGGHGPQAGRRNEIVVPRRSGRRGNR